MLRVFFPLKTAILDVSRQASRRFDSSCQENPALIAFIGAGISTAAGTAACTYNLEIRPDNPRRGGVLYILTLIGKVAVLPP